MRTVRFSGIESCRSLRGGSLDGGGWVLYEGVRLCSVDMEKGDDDCRGWRCGGVVEEAVEKSVVVELRVCV